MTCNITEKERSFRYMKRLGLLLVLVAVITALAACSGNADNNASGNQNSNEQENTNEGEGGMDVDVQDADEDIVGTATLTEEDNGVQVNFKGEDLPKGIHAFHIHETGECEAPDFESAGDHFNPDDADHGFDEEDGPHAGDMPNIAVGEDGNVEQSFLLEDVTLDEDDEHSLVDDKGTALVIHEDADDGESQPAGDAGDRMACGTITQKQQKE